MPIRTLRDRQLWNFRAPSSVGETRRAERWLASARVFLAISAVVAIWLDASSVQYSFWAYCFLAFYVAHGVVILVLLRFRHESTSAFRILVHLLDLLWPALITLFAAGSNSPFFLFFIFLLAASAYRWGLLETVASAAASVVLLFADSLIVRLGYISRIDAFFYAHKLPLLGVSEIEFEPRRLFMRSIYLLVMGLLLGYLAEQQKRLRAEKSVVARVLERARVEAGLTGTLQAILGDIMSMFGSSRLFIASQESSSHHAFVGEMRLFADQSEFKWHESPTAEKPIYLAECSAEAIFVNPRRVSDNWHAIALDGAGNRIKSFEPSCLRAFAEKHGSQRFIVISFVFGQEWWGRTFILDPSAFGEPEEELHFLQELIRRIGPAVYNVYLLRRLRQRASALERARFARELHDGAVQSLIAVEMQVDVLRRQAENKPEVVPDELSRIQSLLRDEVLKLRELMQQLKSLEVDSRRLVPFINSTVERFQRETGISARFVADVEKVDLDQQICREIARIIQEALVNVRKHSRATSVLVRLTARSSMWHVIVEDDGKGFPFSGLLTEADLERIGRAPAIIQERVRLVEGQLAIESNPGKGSRLEISIPRKTEDVYG